MVRKDEQRINKQMRLSDISCHWHDRPPVAADPALQGQLLFKISGVANIDIGSLEDQEQPVYRVLLRIDPVHFQMTAVQAAQMDTLLKLTLRFYSTQQQAELRAPADQIVLEHVCSLIKRALSKIVEDKDQFDCKELIPVAESLAEEQWKEIVHREAKKMLEDRMAKKLVKKKKGFFQKKTEVELT